jgi:hypothetical protein
MSQNLLNLTVPDLLAKYGITTEFEYDYNKDVKTVYEPTTDVIK